MLGIEIEGYTHQFAETYYLDMEKEDKMAELAMAVLRFPNVEVMNNIENFILDFE